MKDGTLPLQEALLRPECYPHTVDGVEKIETHISWVFLAGEFAYKVKKPVALGFLDFSTLEARRRYCEKELRLNRRFAPDLYLDVVEIRGSPAAPRIAGDGALLDYALRMRRFAADALASRRLAAGALSSSHVAEFGRYLARFHAAAPAEGTGSDFGAPATVLKHAIENFDQIAPLLDSAEDRAVLARLRAWTCAEFERRRATLGQRHADGRVRECHGDLHLNNIVLIEAHLVPFDCIEFSAALRWNDVMSEVAFLAMDFFDRGATDLAWHFLNAYLETGGDYDGLAVLRFYLVYRALVRAKVHLIRARDPATAPAESERLTRIYRHYIDLARRFASPGKPAIVLMHGFSGSGKSTIAAALAPALGAVRIRSDVERKRLHGLEALARSDSGLDAGLYDSHASALTYERLRDAALATAGAGYTAIVDAAFLQRSQRRRFAEIAHARAIPAVLLDVQAPEHVLRSRVAARTGDASEATLDVLEHQLAGAEPVSADERLAIVTVNGETGYTPALEAEVSSVLASAPRAR